MKIWSFNHIILIWICWLFVWFLSVSPVSANSWSLAETRIVKAFEYLEKTGNWNSRYDFSAFYEVKSNCRVVKTLDSLIEGGECFGWDKGLFYIGDKEVSAKAFYLEKKIYIAQWPICVTKETTDSSIDSNMPPWFIAKCSKKWKRGIFIINGTKVTFSKFFHEAIESLKRENNRIKQLEITRTLEEINTVYGSFESFMIEVRKIDGTFASKYPKIGSVCPKDTNKYRNQKITCQSGLISFVEYSSYDKSILTEAEFFQRVYEQNKKLLQDEIEYINNDRNIDIIRDRIHSR